MVGRHMRGDWLKIWIAGSRALDRPRSIARLALRSEAPGD
jgi:hypothetical protein